MKINKRNVDAKTIEKYVLVFVLVLVLFKVIASVFPMVTASAIELNGSGFPLAEFFLADGALWYLVGAALLFVVYRSFSTAKK